MFCYVYASECKMVPHSGSVACMIVRVAAAQGAMSAMFERVHYNEVVELA